MGAPAYRNNSGFVTSITTATVNLPGGTQVGDLLLMFVETTSSNAAPATPTGWTSVGTPANTGTTAGSPATQTRCSAFYRYAQSGDTSWTLADPGDHICVIILAFYNVNQTTPIDTSATNTSGTAGQVSGTVTFPSVTTSVDDCLIVYGGADGWDAVAAQFTGSNFTPAATLVSAGTKTGNNTNNGNGGGLGTAIGAMGSAGSVGTTTWGLAGGAQQWACWTIALPPGSTDSVGVLCDGDGYRP